MQSAFGLPSVTIPGIGHTQNRMDVCNKAHFMKQLQQSSPSQDIHPDFRVGNLSRDLAAIGTTSFMIFCGSVESSILFFCFCLGCLDFIGFPLEPSTLSTDPLDRRRDSSQREELKRTSSNPQTRTAALLRQRCINPPVPKSLNLKA